MQTVFITPVLWLRLNRAMRRRSEGQAIVLVALFAVSMVAVVGLAIDGGLGFIQAQQLQRATDAAAMAGVVWMPGQFSTAQTLAYQTLRTNGVNVANGDTSMVTVTPGLSIPPQNLPNRLGVTATVIAHRFFLGVIGFSDYPITRNSVAEFTLPVPMGARDNTFGLRSPHPDPHSASTNDSSYVPGGNPLCTTTPCDATNAASSSFTNPGSDFRTDAYTNGAPNTAGFWANILGPDDVHVHGDAYGPKFGGQWHNDTGSYTNNESSCTYSSSTYTDCNPDYLDNPGSSGTGGSGYDYVVNVKAQDYSSNRIVAINVFDGNLSPQGTDLQNHLETQWTGDTVDGDSHFDPYNGANLPYSTGNYTTWSEFQTIFTLYAATFTPAAGFPVTPAPMDSLNYPNPHIFDNTGTIMRQFFRTEGGSSSPGQMADGADHFRIPCTDSSGVTETIPPHDVNQSTTDNGGIPAATLGGANPTFNTSTYTFVIAQNDSYAFGGCISWASGNPSGSLMTYHQSYPERLQAVAVADNSTTSTWGGHLCKPATVNPLSPANLCEKFTLLLETYNAGAGFPNQFHDMRAAGNHYNDSKRVDDVWLGQNCIGGNGTGKCLPMFSYEMNKFNNGTFPGPYALIRMNINISQQTSHDLRHGGGSNRYALIAYYLDCPANATANYLGCTEVPMSQAHPQIYALGAMALYNNIQQGGAATNACLDSTRSAIGCVNSDFDLAQITSNLSGQTLIISLFDPGDVVNKTQLDMGLLDPNGQPMFFSSECSYRAPGYNTTATTCQMEPPYTDPQSGVTFVSASLPNHDRIFDNSWLVMKVVMPSAAIFASYPGQDPTINGGVQQPDPNQPNYNPCGCWFQIRYSLSNTNASYLSATDNTTWRMDIDGDPVHLIV